MVCDDTLKQMITVCAWCHKELGRRWTTNGGTSHGICDECRAKLLKDREGGKADVQLSAPSGIDCNEMEEAWPKERHPRTAETEGVPSKAVGRLRDHDPSLPYRGAVSELMAMRRPLKITWEWQNANCAPSR